MEKIKFGNELPNPAGEKMIRKENSNIEFHSEMECIITGPKLILFSLGR